MPPVNRNRPVRAESSESDYSMMEFMREFPDDATCLDWLWRRNYSADGKTAECPKCERPRSFHRVKSRPSYSCDSCGHHLHPTAQTIFHKSSTSLHLWFYGIFLMSQTRCGISAKQLERELGVTYKTAWRMFNRIRSLLQEDDGPLGGDGQTVEVDETYMGAKKKRGTKPGRPGKDSHKTPVFGMVERGGRVVAKVMPELSQASVMPEIRARILPHAMIYTDEYQIYTPLAKAGYHHRRVYHGAKIYVDGPVHTNTIEGFFALLKNGIRGVYHSVSRKHLQDYLDEYAFRYNHRDDTTPMFKTVLGNIAWTP